MFNFRKTRTKRTKYGNRKVTIGGVTYDSVKEAERDAFLSLLEQQGIIKDLQRQVKFELIPKITHEEVIHLKTKDKTILKTDQLPIHYTADFCYTIVETNEYVVEDVKGNKKLMSADVPLRMKLMYWRYKIKVKLIYKANQSIYGNEN